MISFFFIVDAAFFSANLIKIFEGGYVPLLVGAAIFAAMTTWRKGRLILFDRIAKENPRYEEFWEEMHCASMARVPGVAIYLTSRADRVPSSLKLNVKHNKCLHETVILLTVLTERIPRVAPHRRVVVEPLAHGFVRMTLRYGFAQSPNVPRSLRRAIERNVDLGCEMDCDRVSYFVGTCDTRALDAARDDGLAGAHLHFPHQKRHDRVELLLHPLRTGGRGRYVRGDLGRISLIGQRKAAAVIPAKQSASQDRKKARASGMTSVRPPRRPSKNG